MLIYREENSVEGVRFCRFEGKPTDAELEVHLDFERARLKEEPGTPRVLVVELRDAWTSAQRRRMRDFEENTFIETNVSALGMAMVVPNAVIRGAFAAYFWLSPPRYPTTAVASASEAYDFVTGCLSAVGAPLPGRERFVNAAKRVWKGRIVRGGRYFEFGEESGPLL